MLTPEQVTMLNEPLADDRVAHRRQAGVQLSYIETWDAMDTANRIFGHDGWGYSLDRLEQQGDVWIAAVTVTVQAGDRRIARQDVGVGIPAKPRDHPMPSPEATETAVKGAVSDATKRALRSFGPQFGLMLYSKEGPPAPHAAGGDDAKATPAAPRPAHPTATPTPAKPASIGAERGSKLEGLVQKALTDQGATVSYAYDWLDAALRRLQKHRISDLTDAEGRALLERAARADVTQAPAVAGPASGPSPMDVRPGPDGTWESTGPDEMEEVAPACPTCGGPMTYKEGTNKAGKPYAGHFCVDRNCSQKPLWVDAGGR